MTLLQDGRVLIARGEDLDEDMMFESRNAGSEIYDPVLGTWSVTPRSLTNGTIWHSATLLPNGKVLVAGGNAGGVGGDTILGFAEVFDPASGTWSATGSLETARFRHTATLLPTGEILVVGGTNERDHYPKLKYENLNSAEIYDSRSGSWTRASNLGSARGEHTATLLQDGRVLVAGGSIVGPRFATVLVGSAELYGTPRLPGDITIGITGSWYDPAQSGHGLHIEILPNSQFLAAWFAFNSSGTQQSWFVGTGTYSGNTATVTSVQPAGGRWIPNFDSTRVVNNAWGLLTFTFSDCNHGKVDFSSTLPGYGAGVMNLTRLTQPAGLACP
ncbi:MAG: kelch repeat-containing protein [Casimicrobiaceae bacterium]